MTFASPLLLWGLLLIPLALGAYVLAQRRRARYAVRFTNLDLLANLIPRTAGWRRHVPALLYLAALAALLLSLARPRMMVPVPKEQATVVMVAGHLRLHGRHGRAAQPHGRRPAGGEELPGRPPAQVPGRRRLLQQRDPDAPPPHHRPPRGAGGP